MDDPLDKYAEVETGEAFTIQNPRLLKVELSETTVMARSGAMVAYQGDVRFEHKGGGFSRLIKKAATGESLRLMQASGSGEMFLANQAMLVHVIRLKNDALTVNGANILAFEAGIDWDITKVKGGAAGMLAGGLFNVGLHGTGFVALALRRRAAAARRRRGADLRRPAGGDRLVRRRHHEPQDRHAGQVADRPRLRRELPARLLGPGLGARAAVRGPLHPDLVIDGAPVSPVLVALAGCATVLAFDAIGSLLARRFGFAYALLAPGSLVVVCRDRVLRCSCS